MAKQKKQQNNKLSPLQERFCREYVVLNNATKAAINAGYSKNTARQQASKLLTKVNIKLRIEQLNKEIVESLNIKHASVIENLTRVAQSTSELMPIKAYDDQGNEVETGLYRPVDAHAAINANKALWDILPTTDPKVVAQISKTIAETELLKIKADQLKEYGPDTTTINIIDAWADDDEEG